MAAEIIEVPRPGWRARMSSASATTGVLAALLCLDGQLGVLSLTLQRAIALAVLAPLASFAIVRRGPGKQRRGPAP